MTTTLTANTNGFVVHRQDGSAVHTGGYRAGSSPKLYMAKGHATSAANRLNRRLSNPRYDYATRSYLPAAPVTNPWVVSPAQIVLKEDATKAALRAYLSNNTNVTNDDALNVVVNDLLNIISKNA